MDRGRREIPAYAGMTYKAAGHDAMDAGYGIRRHSRGPIRHSLYSLCHSRNTLNVIPA